MARDYAGLEARFAAWAAAREDIRLAVVVGSRARADWSNDEWGDLDTVIWTTTPDAYAEGRCLADLGEVWITYAQFIRPGTREWLAVLADDLDFDMAVVPAEAPLTPEQVLAAQMESVFARGVRVLLDRDGVWDRLPASTLHQPDLPDDAVFQQVVHRFWRYAGRAAKKLRRGELYVAVQTINGLLHDQVLTLTEWHALAHDPAADVWYEGHFLERWADPRVVVALRDTAAPYDTQSAWRALLAVCAVFDWLSQETAGRLALNPPTAPAEQLLHRIQNLAAGQAD